MWLVAPTQQVRPKVGLACEVCARQNYITTKNRHNDPDRFTIKKFCPRCRCHQLHKETRMAFR